MKKGSLFQKFTFLVVPMIVATAVVVGLGLSLISQNAFERTIRADYTLAAALASRQIEFFLHNAFQETKAAAAFVAAIRLDRWRTQMAIMELRHKFPQFQYMALTDLQGYAVNESWFNQDLYDRQAWMTFEEASKGRLAYSRIVIRDHVPVMFVAAPVFYDGRQTAVIWGRLNVKPIWDVAIQLKRDLNFGVDGHVYLLDQEKTLIASDGISDQFGRRLTLEDPPDASETPHLDIETLRDKKRFDTFDPETLKSLLKDWHSRPSFWINDLDGQRMILVKSIIPGVDWSLYMIQPYSEAFHFLDQGVWLSVGLVLMVILAGVVLTWITARRFLRPIARLHQGVARAAGGNLSQPIEVHSNDEVEELARSFNHMQAAIQDYINRLMTTTSDLNHAKCLAVLGTTASKVNHQVGNFLNNLSLALSILKADHLSESSQASLEVIEENTRQIKTFIEHLLKFARRADLTLAPWHARTALKRLLDAYRPAADEKGVILHFDATEAPVVLADHALLEEAVNNLIRNALDATPSGGTITVRAAVDGERLKITVSDTGHGISPEDLENVFTPFFTTKRGKGTGLGLSLVQTVIEAHGGEIGLTSRPGEGAVADLWLPPAPAVMADSGAILDHSPDRSDVDAPSSH